MDIRIKRAYDDPATNDGTRVLVDRIWPRGVAKAALPLDDWNKDVAPSTGLRKWYSHDVEKFEEFAARYREELDTPDGRTALGRALLATVLLLVGGLMAGCGPSDGPGSGSEPSPKASTTVGGDASESVPPKESSSRATISPSPSSSRPKKPRSRTLHGIDVSHHQGAIDWSRVAGDDIDFAYLKATEGSGFTDDLFVTNAAAAHRAGLKVGGYHYYTLCSEPEPQAAHFVDVLDQARTNLPPVVDLELIGNCDPPPDKATLQSQVETFIGQVEDATGKDVVVYFHPDFEAHYAMVEDLDRRLWVRRMGSRPPPGDWFIWQRDDAGSVDGVGTPVDRDVMRRN